MSTIYHKHFIPLESNPELFTQLMQQLGGGPSLTFEDILSLDDPDLLAFIARPVHALVLTFPTTRLYEEDKRTEEEKLKVVSVDTIPHDILWFKQTINNACGLYGLIHAVCSSRARDIVKPDSFFYKLIQNSPSLSASDRASALEQSEFLEAEYQNVATKGDSTVPDDPEEEVDYHYICFVLGKNGRVYELDGDRNGPVDRGVLLRNGEDILGEGMLAYIGAFMRRYQHENMSFNLMALAEARH